MAKEVKDAEKMRVEKEAISATLRISGRQVRRVVYHGTELTKLREKTGLSQAEFGVRCGWNQQYQSRLELPYEQEINIDKLNTINQVAEEILKTQV